MSGHFLSHSNSFSFELEKDAAGCRALNRNFIVGGDIMQTEFPERYITLGLKIAYYRKKAGMTQEVLAERIGKSVNFVGQVEGTGTVRGVSLETLFKIAQVLKIPPSKLLEDD
ncbi:helix-turn-helix transcriptional regulator [Erysipelatoclostridium ramosum]|nr:helix-turn-helix transcriptional regulator [Thomasclavelia ramosa]MDB7038396.1 helix-turn-helix transcriptional regulator [Thomasclavelia ramosa]